MTDDEIRTIYREAADKKKQVQILADLNAVSRREMQEKLEELGIDAEKPRKKIGGRVKLNFDEMRAKELYDEGLTDLQIAECLGVAEYTVGKWRRGEGLFRPKGKQTVQSHEAGGAGENDTPAACQSRTGPRRWIEPAHCEEKGKTGGAEPRPCGSEATTPPSRQKRDTSPYTGEALKSAEGNKATTAEETEEVRYMSAEALLDVLQRLVAAYPGERVEIYARGEGQVTDVMVSICYDADGDVRDVEVGLYTEG